MPGETPGWDDLKRNDKPAIQSGDPEFDRLTERGGVLG